MDSDGDEGGNSSGGSVEGDRISAAAGLSATTLALLQQMGFNATHEHNGFCEDSTADEDGNIQFMQNGDPKRMHLLDLEATTADCAADVLRVNKTSCTHTHSRYCVIAPLL